MSNGARCESEDPCSVDNDSTCDCGARRCCRDPAANRDGKFSPGDYKPCSHSRQCSGDWVAPARALSTHGVNLLEIEAAQVVKRCNVVPSFFVLLHHPLGREPCSRDPSHCLPHRPKSSAAPVDHAVGEGPGCLTGAGADCMSALAHDFLPTRNGRLGSWAIL